MNSRRNRTLRIDEETLFKLKNTSLKLSALQGDNVPIGEVIKRSFNIPNLNNILETDAATKRRLLKK